MTAGALDPEFSERPKLALVEHSGDPGQDRHPWDSVTKVRCMSQHHRHEFAQGIADPCQQSNGNEIDNQLLILHGLMVDMLFLDLEDWGRWRSSTDQEQLSRLQLVVPLLQFLGEPPLQFVGIAAGPEGVLIRLHVGPEVLREDVGGLQPIDEDH